jgi:DNA-binding PucR family transcriptional regulator
VVSPTDYILELLLARSPRVAELARRRVLGPLETYTDPRSSDLVLTLATFVELRLDRRSAAERLHVHPNTLDYRLERISKLTGLELRRPRDMALVTLALRQRELAAG